jgi:hypothetical protein
MHGNHKIIKDIWQLTGSTGWLYSIWNLTSRKSRYTKLKLILGGFITLLVALINGYSRVIYTLFLSYMW